MENKIKWSIDPSHSEVAFKVRHLMIASVKGSFKIFDASIYTIGDDFKTAEVDLWIDPSSITTGNEERDTHLKDADFFDVEKHKQISFTSSTLGKADKDGNQELWGEFTMKGITKNLKLNARFGGLATDPWGKEKAGFTISGKLDRSDWDLVWNAPLEAGGFMVSDEVTISCELELIKAGKTDATMELVTETNDEKGIF